VVVAESYARIFFRNCMSTGELYPVETDMRVCDELKTGALTSGRCWVLVAASSVGVQAVAMLMLCCVMAQAV
jgi:3-isopropylmalate dehydratase small subunit